MENMEQYSDIYEFDRLATEALNRLSDNSTFADAGMILLQTGFDECANGVLVEMQDYVLTYYPNGDIINIEFVDIIDANSMDRINREIAAFKRAVHGYTHQ